MRNVPGWVLGALGVTAIVGATYAGSRIGAAAAAPATSAIAPASTLAHVAETTPATLGELAVECEPGQRAVVSTGSIATTARVSCVSDPKPVGRAARAALVPAEAPVVSAPVVYADDLPVRPQPRRAAIVNPVEVYQPRSVPVSSPTRAEIEPRRSVKKSVAIIAGSTAAGAVVGGLTRGKKGAVIGGIVGGGAATVWDQVTRRRDDR